MITIDELITHAKIQKDNEGDFEASVILYGLDVVGIGATKPEAIQHLKEFLIIAEAEYQAGRLA
jgi:hypothetical protein